MGHHRYPWHQSPSQRRLHALRLHKTEQVAPEEANHETETLALNEGALRTRTLSPRAAFANALSVPLAVP